MKLMKRRLAGSMPLTAGTLLAAAGTLLAIPRSARITPVKCSNAKGPSP